MVLDVSPAGHEDQGGEPALLASLAHTHGAKQRLAPATSPLERVRASVAGSLGLLPYVLTEVRASLVSVRVILVQGRPPEEPEDKGRGGGGVRA